MPDTAADTTRPSAKPWLVPALRGLWLVVTIAILWTAFARGGVWWAVFLGWIPLNLMLMAAWKDRHLDVEHPEEFLEDELPPELLSPQESPDARRESKDR
jgi:hypothetical protein